MLMMMTTEICNLGVDICTCILNIAAGLLPCHRSSVSSVLLENSVFSNVFQYLRYTALCVGVRIERMYRGNVMGVRLCHADASKKRQFYSCRKCYASLYKIIL